MPRSRRVRTAAIALVLGAGLVHVPAAAADEVLTAWHLAPADGTGPGAAPPAPVPPMLAEVTGPATPIDLADLLVVAVRQAPALARARIDVDIAEAEIAAARAWADWAVSASVSGSTRQAGSFFARQDDISVSGDLTRALSTGGALGVRVNGGWQRTDTALGIDKLYTEQVAVTFAQPLLRGRGRAMVEAEQRIAATARDADAMAARGAAIEVVRDLVLAYLDLVAAERDLDIRRASLGLAEERLRVTEAGIRAGGTAKAETIAVEQAIATREEDILVGELSVLQRSLDLRRQASLPIGPRDMLLASNVDLAIPARSWDQAALVDAALASSPELAVLAAQEAGATITIEVTDNGLLPALDLALAFGPSGTADDPGEAALNMVKFDAFAASASLIYRTTLSRSEAKADARKVRSQRELIRVNAADMRAQVIQAVVGAVAQVQVAERRFGIAARSVALAEQNLVVEQARLSLGKSRNVDVLLRQDELRTAQLRSAQAVIDWHKAATLIEALTGELLPRYGITLP